jgi:hypothetical protein
LYIEKKFVPHNKPSPVTIGNDNKIQNFRNKKQNRKDLKISVGRTGKYICRYGYGV